MPNLLSFEGNENMFPENCRHMKIALQYTPGHFRHMGSADTFMEMISVYRASPG